MSDWTTRFESPETASADLDAYIARKKGAAKEVANTTTQAPSERAIVTQRYEALALELESAGMTRDEARAEARARMAREATAKPKPKQGGLW